MRKGSAVKVLCLIFDSIPHEDWQATYAVHRQLWNACLDRCPAVDGYFLRADPGLATDHSLERRCFTARSEEGHAAMLFKMQRALGALLTDHDYVVRAALSSLFDFPLLTRQDLPITDLYLGHLVEGKYVTGSGMILSRDVAQKLAVPSSLPLEAWEDVATWQLLSAQGVVARHREAFVYDYGKDLDQVTVGEHVHYRVRDYGDPLRVKEREVAEHVFRKIYGLA